MTYRGTILNGVVVFDGAHRPSDGTAVEVRPMNDTGTATLDEMASQQCVTGGATFDALLGGWPDDDSKDRFEDAVARWRGEEPRRTEL